MRPSMGSVGDCFDNAMCESFFATLECELLNRRSFKTQAEARMAVFDFIEIWDNPITAIPRSTICRRSTTKGAIQQRLLPAAQHRLPKRGNSRIASAASSAVSDGDSVPGSVTKRRRRRLTR